MLFDFVAVGRSNANSAMQNVGFWVKPNEINI